ncbi:MAG TPA: 5-oxoprolinase/urea amidolyase family protein [Solirubrobacteraceae bacterium]|nr:5-oxoprolinase/urea amidolyase family protein [Solirubrobacteraceae bacterium]
MRRVLVANRGEIAVRLVRAAQRLGLQAVAVFSDADRGAPHVALADEAVRLGPAPARESYLCAEKLLDAAARTGAQALHPGYGLLSEDAAFARAVQDAGLIWVGPTPEQLELFGRKDAARALAAELGLPRLPGSELLADAPAALLAAARIGYPVMLKAAAGGGGIGMSVCRTPDELREAHARTTRLAEASFGSGAVFLERFLARARHVEVQVFGDGEGEVLLLGERDCTLQRRHQKVLEEAPAPALPARVREALASAARTLTAATRYRSAGTVEFLYDPNGGEVAFLEVNARLQVEHTVTEEACGVDLAGWMLRLAGGDRSMFAAPVPAPSRHAVQARVYAEDPGAGHRPSAGLITRAELPGGVRVDGWVATGTEVSSAYDPLLAKVIATGDTREQALAALARALAQTRIDGIATNLALLRAALADPDVRAAEHCTSTLERVTVDQPRIEVLQPGTMTTVQDWPGRLGYWHVGVPPSGPMDDRSFRLGNDLLGNPPGAAGLECTLVGPRLRFARAARVCLAGAASQATLDGVPVEAWRAIDVPAGATLDVGAIPGPGLRTYLLIAGGIDVPCYLDSAATFTLGGFGGHGGRALRTGDVIAPGNEPTAPSAGEVGRAQRPPISSDWEVGVLEGPQAAPEFLTEQDVEQLYGTAWEVHFNSARTGVRLIGPRPRWARPDGGEAGLHPSNIHDTPYAIGAIDMTGDTPIVLGPDGPSLGGFVCPATVTAGERWKLGQLRPGDRVRFRPLGPRDGGVLGSERDVTFRRSGDENLLVEFGPMVLDLGLRMRAHALAAQISREGVSGVLELTEGIRSLQVHVDPARLTVAGAMSMARTLLGELPPTEALTVSSRVVHLPLSWDDPATREATARYMAGVRADAPWCPWNLEFIRRINGLPDVQAVREIVFAAEYLVLGLGDVYLGAPVATPIDPRHRLVTTKYNPARTWTPENAVGIGGAYLCIYGMEGPGGYQFVGRTVQVWDRWREVPWLLRPFDRIRWHPVSAEELLEQRADLPAGRLVVPIDEGRFSLAEQLAFVAAERSSIDAFRTGQQAAFAQERARWEASGEFGRDAPPVVAAGLATVELPEHASLVAAPLAASVWTVEVSPGDRVRAGERLLTLEAMKTETALESPIDGRVLQVLVAAGDQVHSGAALVVVAP